ncbi:MAG: hypothetical protein UHS49_00220 [Faecalimonas sp.]|nr:hypothetical protein [Faecalimonas sp.]
MKKNSILVAIYSIMASLYIALSLILVTERNTTFWIGIAMVVFSVAIAAIITAVVNKEHNSAFLIGLSMVGVSAIYIAVVISINLLFGCIFDTPVHIFVSIHILCLALYAGVVLLLFLVKPYIVKQGNQDNEKNTNLIDK